MIFEYTADNFPQQSRVAAMTRPRITMRPGCPDEQVEWMLTLLHALEAQLGTKVSPMILEMVGYHHSAMVSELYAWEVDEPIPEQSTAKGQQEAWDQHEKAKRYLHCKTQALKSRDWLLKRLFPEGVPEDVEEMLDFDEFEIACAGWKPSLLDTLTWN